MKKNFLILSFLAIILIACSFANNSTSLGEDYQIIKLTDEGTNTDFIKNNSLNWYKIVNQEGRSYLEKVSSKKIGGSIKDGYLIGTKKAIKDLKNSEWLDCQCHNERHFLKIGLNNSEADKLTDNFLEIVPVEEKSSECANKWARVKVGNEYDCKNRNVLLETVTELETPSKLLWKGDMNNDGYYDFIFVYWIPGHAGGDEEVTQLLISEPAESNWREKKTTATIRIGAKYSLSYF